VWAGEGAKNTTRERFETKDKKQTFNALQFGSAFEKHALTTRIFFPFLFQTNTM
jgi:hypothetical protein